MRIPFIRIPFASSGDKSSIPDATQPNGSISMQSGWGADYEKEVGVDPAAKSVNRQDMNQVLYLATALLNKWQVESFPEWIDSASNGGSPFQYPLGSVVRYSTDGIAPYVAWVNNIAGNATSPSEANGWIQFSDVASRSRQATETVQGTMEVATQAEADAGLLDTVAVTPKKMRFGFSALIQANGYIAFPSWMSGIIIQWGNGGGFLPSGTITFPIAFVNSCFSVVLTRVAANANTTGFSVNTITTNSFSFLSTDASSTTFNWISIGR